MYIEWAVASHGWISLTCCYILSRLLCGGASSILCVLAAEIARRSYLPTHCAEQNFALGKLLVDAVEVKLGAFCFNNFFPYLPFVILVGCAHAGVLTFY